MGVSVPSDSVSSVPGVPSSDAHSENLSFFLLSISFYFDVILKRKKWNVFVKW